MSSPPHSKEKKLPPPTSTSSHHQTQSPISLSLPLSLSGMEMEKSKLILSPDNNGGGRRRSSDSNSPDFQFWMVRNPSFPQPNLLSADELFVNGVLLPLDYIQPTHNQSDPPDTGGPPIIPNSESESPIPVTESESRVVTNSVPGPELSAVTTESSTGLTSSKRWKDIFKKGEKKKTSEDKDKEKRLKERKSQPGTSSAELNINIWPFSRSRSAGNSGNRPRNVASGGAPGTRKVSSAPCSRSNSAGESKSRKWPSSPGRPGGVHLGRSSPVWQVRRGGTCVKTSEPVVRSTERGVKKELKKEVPEIRRTKPTISAVSTAAVGGNGAKNKVLDVNVPMCIGYRHHLSCRGDGNNAIGVASSSGTGVSNSGGSNGGGGGSHSGGGSGGGANLFNFRNLFTKKVY